MDRHADHWWARRLDCRKDHQADRRAAESPFAFEVNDVTAWAEVRRLASYWATQLRRRLEEIEKV